MMKHNGPIAKKMIAAALVAGSMGTFGAGAASAGHIHSMTTGNDSCVLLAQNGGEKDVTLPHADDFPDNRRHPLHVNVHLGAPGRSGEIGVQGTSSDPCLGGEYVND